MLYRNIIADLCLIYGVPISFHLAEIFPDWNCC